MSFVVVVDDSVGLLHCRWGLHAPRRPQQKDSKQRSGPIIVQPIRGFRSRIRFDSHGANVHWYKVNLSRALGGEDLNGEERKKFKLEVTVHSSMLLYDPQGSLEYYSSPMEVFQVFSDERMEIYKKRKAAVDSEDSTLVAKNLWMEDLTLFEESVPL
ncbi:unnamed protein product [Urochloa humidicola]